MRKRAWREGSRPTARCVGDTRRKPARGRFGGTIPSSWHLGSGSVFACEKQERPQWAVVHERLVQISAERRALERELCRWLLEAERLAVHVETGYGSLAEYAERIVGLSPRKTEERLRVGRELEDLPGLENALASGKLVWSVVRELSRVASPETEEAWLKWAEDKRASEVERKVAGLSRGDQPTDGPDPALKEHVLRFKVRAETMALFRDLQAAVRRDLSASELGGVDVDDDMLLFEIARRALGGSGDEGRANYQVAVSQCDTCKQSRIDAAGESHVVDAVAEDMIACDAQHIGDVGVPSPQSPPAGGKRASQTIPPATRRRVMRRDHKRCVVPGCRHHRFVDVHHLDLRSEGGGHKAERMAVLCGFHHRRVHDGTLSIDGTASAGFVFYHADGTPYGKPISPAAIDVAKQAFAALRKMGFKQSQARDRVDAVVRARAPDDLASFIRAALKEGARERT